MSGSVILHIDMDAFYASVEERDDPTLRGKQVVVGAGSRGVVLSANYAARKLGIRAAMPVSRAKRMAPQAIFVHPHHEKYSEVSANVMNIFHTYTPLVEPLSLDEAFLDVTGSQRLKGSGREIAQRIREEVASTQGITCSVGIASTKFIAKLASQHCKPNGLLEIAPDRVLEFLHPLPVSAIWGVGPKTNEALHQLGLMTVADIANTPRSTLIRALGEGTGASLYELAWGRDFRDVEPESEDRSISAAETFAHDIDGTEELLTEFLRLTEKATSRMRRKNLAAYTISIKVRFSDFKTITRSKTVDLPISGTQECFDIVRTLFLALKLERARLRLVGVSLENLIDDEDAPSQMILGERERGWREATQAIDRASQRFGRGSVRPARLVEPGSGDGARDTARVDPREDLLDGE